VTMRGLLVAALLVLRLYPTSGAPRRYPLGARPRALRPSYDRKMLSPTRLGGFDEYDSESSDEERGDEKNLGIVPTQ
jgi:hypothetical protein